MNARIQVEHPVTEQVTGLDLVAEQIRIAAGAGLAAGAGRRCALAGAAPSNAASTPRIRRADFMPSPGRMTRAEWPQGEGIRVDTHIAAGSMVPPYYDSLLGKIIAHGVNARSRARHACVAALAATRIEGVRTNLEFQCRAAGRCRIRAPVASTPTGFLAAQGRRPEWLTSQLVETSLRDGNQCLWGATGIDTARTLTIAPVMERVGFKAIDFTTSTHMGVAVRYKREDPWERIRLMAAATPRTPLQFMSTGFRFIAWETASPEFMALAFRTLARNGIRRFCLADPMNDVDAQIACARMVKQVGGEFVIAALVYTLSPIHDDAHYVASARRLAACPDVDALYIKDPGGLLMPQRARTLIPAIKAVIGAKKLELHSHYTIGLAELAYMEAPDYGVSAVQCASGAAADGTSNPPAGARGGSTCVPWAIASTSMTRRWPK